MPQSGQMGCDLVCSFGMFLIRGVFEHPQFEEEYVFRRSNQVWVFTLCKIQWFILFASIIGVVLNLIDNAIGWGIILSAIWSLVILLPVLGLYFRRLHDTDRSAWWLLLMLIPFIGTIVLIVFWASKGTADTNKFGAPVS
jgi:uncharacterized membrane protein YhaH (DUF805 family)